MQRAARAVVGLWLILTSPLLFAAPPLLAAAVHASDLPTTRFTSPRIAALAKELATDSKAIERFWREMEGNSPIIEAIAGDPACSWVTFVWRGNADTGRVRLLGGPVIHDFSKWLERLGETDVWYRTERMPNDARFVYSFQVNRPVEWPLDPVEGAAMYKQYLPRPDPFNAHVEYDGSVLEMPDAPPQPWLGRVEGMTAAASKLWLKIPGVPRGAVRSHVIASKTLKQDRRVDVYTPIGYDAAATKTYRLLVLLEGSGVNDLLDNLSEQKRMPPVVMVVPHFVNRNAECECSEPFADFMADELLPWVREHYNVTAAREQTIVGGFSYGGLAAAFCAFRHPEAFGNVLTMSGSYWWFPGAGTPAVASSAANRAG
jgi:hypothetical protein